MSLKIQALKNIGSSWLGLVVNSVVGFLLSPFVLHRLGDYQFGLWVLMASLTGYYGLLDIGIRSSVIQYVARFTATKDANELNGVMNTSLCMYCSAAAVLLIFTGFGALYIDPLFHVTPAFHRTGQLLFVMVGTAVAVGFPLAVFGGALEGLQRFYWLNVTQIVTTLLRAFFVVMALLRGKGILTVAAITLAFPLLNSALLIPVVRRLIPFTLGWKYVDRRSFRRVFSFGSITFISMVASRLRFRTDAMVIGIFMSASAITLFSVGSRLVDYVTELVTGLSQIFTPLSSQFNAAGDKRGLQRVFILGNQACALVMFPLCAILVLLGKSVIALWVGPRYVSASYPVLLILLLPRTLEMAQNVSPKVLYGMARHRTLALVRFGEGVINLVLSILLIRPFGIVGDAFGTAIPLTCSSIFFLPRHLCRQLGLPIGKFLRESYLLPLILCAPMVVVLLLTSRLFHAPSYFQLLVQLVSASLAYGVAVGWYLLTRHHMAPQLRARMERFLAQAARG